MIRLAKRYELDDDPIGQGGMGTVFRGVDVETGQAIAAKRLKPEAVKSDPQILERFEREGDALSRLNHPNIVKMLGTVDNKKEHYIILEYVPGGDLGDLLKAKGRLSIERTLQIGIELSDALTRAHYLKIIHRDLKPANVLMGEDNVPKLTDFGVAHIGGAGHMTGVGLAVGTPDYMSPEAINGEEVDDRADIWSMGVMLFEMLTGKHPFRGDAVTNTLINILTQQQPNLETLRPETPIALIDLIERMLQKDINTRISSVRLVGAELEAIMRGRGDTRRTTLTTPITIPALDETRFETPTPPTFAPKHNLPAQTTPFFGREMEIHEISQLLGQPDTRLVTLLGQGGMGKTRLALQAAEFLVHAFEHGVYFVGLASLPNAEGVPSAVADAVGYTLLTDGRDPAAQVIDYLREKSMLLVFDNFEQVLSGADFVADLLRAAPRLKLMVTSRERLNLTGETIVALGGLDLPEANDIENAMQYSAVKLFIQSARRSSPGFEVNDGDLRHIIRICRSVDGLPLGVVLAASWTDSLSVVEIADEITRSLDFLESELRDLPARHRSMRAVFDYSWALLSDSEREAYAKLSVFMGGFTREAAQAVANASLRTLTTLQNKSLVRRHPDSGRYELHELVRQYAAERLSQQSDNQRAAMAAHADFYNTFLLKHGEVYMSAGQELKTLQAIEAERDNIRAAWTYAIETDRLDLLDKSMGVVAMFFEAKGLAQEGSDVFHEIAEAILQSPNPDPVLIARSRVYGAQMEVFLGDYAHATKDAEAALVVFEANNLPMEMGKAYNVLAYVAMNHGRYDDALDALERSIRVLRASGHKHADMLTKRGEATLAYVLFLQGEYTKSEAIYRQLMKEAEEQQAFFAMYHYNNLGEVLHAQGRDDEARPLIQKALDAFIAIKNLRWQAVALVNLGLIEHSASRFVEAESYFRRALPLYKENGDRRGVAEALNRLGSTVYWYGKYRESIDLHKQAYNLFTELGNRKGAADALVLCSIAQNALGDYDGAKHNLDTAFELRGAMGNITEIADVQQILAVNAMYRSSYDEGLMYLDQARDILEGTQEPDPINHIRHQMLQGIILAEAGRYESATPLLEEAVQVMEEGHLYWALSQGMASLAMTYINTGRVDEALEIGRRAVEYGYISTARDWSLLAIIATSWAIALRGNPLVGVEYISYVLNASGVPQQFIRIRGERVLAIIQEMLAAPEFEAAIARGKNLRYEDVVSAVIGRPVEVNT